MDRETALLVALGMLIASSLAVGISGWMLLIRDRRPRVHSISTPTRPKGPDVLELLDLRERGERLEAVRPEIDPTVSETVQRILQRVFVEGDEVLVELAQRFDDADLSDIGLMVRREEFAVAEHETPADLKRALDALIDRLRDLHARQLPSEWWEESDGVRYGEIVRPIRAVGCYVPGGRALYPSSVCMTVVPAVVAGVPEIVLCTPPRADGTIHPAVLYAAKRAGATYVAKTGGAQAIAAMAYGTETIPRSTGSSARATRTSPRRSGSSAGPWGSTPWPDRASSRSSPTATSIPSSWPST